MIEVVIVGLYTLLEALSIVFCLHYLYDQKLRFDKITIIYIMIDVVMMSVIQIAHIDYTWTLLIYPFIVLYCGLKFGFDLKKIVINNVLYVVILSGIQATVIILFNILFKIERVEEFDSLCINAIMLVMVMLCLRRCKLNKLSAILQSNEKIIIISFLVVVASVLLFLISYKQSVSFHVLYYIVLGVSVLMIGVAAIDIGKHKIKATEMEAELRTHKLYEASFRNLIDDIRARQHEFDNHINAIRSLPLCYKTYDELVAAQGKYCEGIQKENRMNKLLSKGNPAITGFLYTKFLELEKEGMPFSYRIVIGELECEVPVYKMVELLGNLIKNAAEAVKERGAGEVRVVMIEEPDRIQIEVSNESDVIDYKKIQQFFKKGYSEKGENRGYGLYNVNKICKDYSIDFAFENRSDEGENKIVFSMTINKSH